MQVTAQADAPKQHLLFKVAFYSHGGSAQSLDFAAFIGPGARHGKDAQEAPLTRLWFFPIGSLPTDSSSAFQKGPWQLSGGHPSGRIFGGYVTTMPSTLAL